MQFSLLSSPKYAVAIYETQDRVIASDADGRAILIWINTIRLPDMDTLQVFAKIKVTSNGVFLTVLLLILCLIR